MLVYQRVDVNRPVSMNLPPGARMIDIMENPYGNHWKSNRIILIYLHGLAMLMGMFKNLPSSKIEDLPCSFVSILR